MIDEGRGSDGGVIEESPLEMLKNLPREDIYKLYNILKRRNYIVMKLLQILNFAQSLLRDFDIVASVDKASLNPSLHLTINITTEIPTHLRQFVYDYPYLIAQAIQERLKEDEALRKWIEEDKKRPSGLYSPKDKFFISKKWKKTFP